MKKVILVAVATLMIPIVSSAATRYDVTLPAARLTKRSTVVNWKAIELRFPKNALTKSTKVKLRNMGELKDTDLPQPKNVYRVRSEVYSYSIGNTLKKDVRVRMNFRFADYGTKRKKILFLPTGEKKWQPLSTTMYKSKNLLHAQLPKRSGKLIVVTHKQKEERPKKRTSFVDFPGTRYSDKAVVMDVKSKKWLYTQKANEPQHIASITKLATVYVFLKQNPDLTQTIKYKDSYDRIGATVELNGGDEVRLSHALYSTLMPSANNMATLLAYNSGFEPAEFVAQMNAIASDLQLTKTRFTEQTGLDDGNVSTPKNTAKYALHVFQSFPDYFQRASNMSTYSFGLENSDKTFTVESTNTFKGAGKYRVKAFKTGYYPGTAERTLVIWVEQIQGKGEIIIVLFGNPVYNTINDEAYELADWAFTHWRFHNY